MPIERIPAAAARLSVCLALSLVLLLAACGVEIEGGVEPPTVPGQPAPTVTRAGAADAGTPADELRTPELPPSDAALTGTATVTSSITLSPTGATTATLQTPAEAADIATGSVFRLGLLEEPADLLPYHTDAADAGVTGPLSEMLFPAPLLPLGYSYTTTGVLARVPTFANGDIALQPVEVVLDEQTGILTPTAALSPTDTLSPSDTLTPTAVFTPSGTLTTAQQLVITYRWNPALTWSDGTALTAADSLFAYELAQQTPLGTDAAAALRLLARYEQVDAHTTRAYLQPEMPDVNQVTRATTATVVPDLSDSAYLRTFWTPLPRHLLADVPPDELARSAFAAQPVGYGPYMLTRRTPGSLRLEPNPHYAGPPPVATAVVVDIYATLEEMQAALANQTLDVALVQNSTPEQTARAAESEGAALRVRYVPSPVWEHLDFNLSFPFLRSLPVRQAIAHAIDREAMINELFGGRVPVLHSWILPDHWAAAPDRALEQYAYDPELARALLDEAGVIDVDDDGLREQGIDHDSDGVLESGAPITLTLLTTEGSPLRAAIAQRIQADLAAVSLSLQVAITPTSELFAPNGPLFQREFELVQFAWIATPDPRGFELWSCNAIPSETNNWTGSNLPGWCLREANETIITATTSLDRVLRRDAYVHHQWLLSQQLPVLPLFQRLHLVLHSPRIEGIRPDPIAPVTWNIATWTSP